MSSRSSHPSILSPSSRSLPASFDHEVVKRRLRRAGFDVVTVTPLPDGTGMKYTALGGAIIPVYFNGNHQVQGKASDDERRRIRRALRPRNG